MYVSPEEFARLLKRSSLSTKEQHSVLRLLPSLTSEQIQDLAKVLFGDVKSQEQILQEFRLKREQLLVEFEHELEKLNPS